MFYKLRYLITMVIVGILSILDTNLVINATIAYGIRVPQDFRQRPGVAVPPGIHWQSVYICTIKRK